MVNIHGHCGERWVMVRDDARQGVPVCMVGEMYGEDDVWWGDVWWG